MNPQTALPTTDLARMVKDARSRTLQLVDDLSDEQLAVRQLDVINPILWELGHVAFFYEEFLLRQLDGASPRQLEGAETLYDSFKVDHDDRFGLPLPGRAETLAYLHRVMDLVLEHLDTGAPTPRLTYLTRLCVLHEDMHGEAFTQLRQTLAYPAPPARGGGEAVLASEPTGPLPGDIEIDGGSFQLGSTPEQPFVFDNEKWAHPVRVAPFRIARSPVTNAEFAAFVDDSGYARRELWSHQGWVWRTKADAHHPLYWQKDERGGWLRRQFDQIQPIPAHEPMMHVSWHEAEAYCRWAGRRLPTEAEWEMVASIEPGDLASSGHKRRHPWGDSAFRPHRANLDANHIGCRDVAAHPAGDSAAGGRQMIGNVWEWTACAFYPFPGYIVDTPYREYSAPWFGYRKVLKGGCWATRARLVHNTFRNFYLPDRRDIFAGFRTCASGSSVDDASPDRRDGFDSVRRC